MAEQSAVHFTCLTTNYCLKTWQEDNSTDNICYLEYIILQTWTALYFLNMHYWGELNIDEGKYVLACF